MIHVETKPVRCVTGGTFQQIDKPSFHNAVLAEVGARTKGLHSRRCGFWPVLAAAHLCRSSLYRP
jgi:hypothetical protein